MTPTNRTERTERTERMERAAQAETVDAMFAALLGHDREPEVGVDGPESAAGVAGVTRQSRLAGAVDRKSCSEVTSLWERANAAEAAGKRRFRGMRLEAWRAKWRDRYEDCLKNAQSADEAADATRELQDALARSDAETAQIEASTRKTAIGLGVAGVLTVLVLVALAVYVRRGRV